jgi:peptide/nickel transport system substrate-binding protein
MPANLDPRMGTDAQSQYLDGLIFNSLVKHDAHMNIVPDLAERWETPDPTTYVFHLRDGVKFHNGAAFSSADVKFTFDSILSGRARSTKLGAFKQLASVDAPDAGTVIFHLREPYASFLWNLSPESIGIVPNGSVTSVAANPIGTGPFRFVRMTPDEDIVLERNPTYLGEPPKVSTVDFRVVPEAVVRALELRKGTADISSPNSLTPDMVLTLAKQKGLVVNDEPGTQLAYVAFNFEDSILAHKEVRQALAYATDRESLIRYLLRGQARPASSLLPPNHWAYEPNVRQYPFDPGRANQLLDQAGFRRGPDGTRFHITLKTSTEESTRLLGEALADQWKSVGVVLDLHSLEFATFYSDVVRGSFQLYTLRWVGGNNDPDLFDSAFNSTRVPPVGFNRGHYRNAQLDTLLNAQRVEADQGKRKELLSQIQKIVAEDEPYIDLWYTDNVCVHRDRVENLELSPTGNFDFLEKIQLK